MDMTLTKSVSGPHAIAPAVAVKIIRLLCLALHHVSPRAYPNPGDRPGDAREGTFGELADQEPRRIDRPRHGGAPLGNALEAAPGVVGLVADQHDQPVALGLGLGERAFDQRLADAALRGTAARP